MKILQVHKNHRLLGGTEKYYFDLINLLSKKGHEVAHFSMKHRRNVFSRWEKYFVSEISFKDINIFDSPKILSRMVYSLEARRRLAELLDEFRPDVAHVHNIYYHISPSVLDELKKRGIPVVYTVHDYHLLTPNVTFFHDKKNIELDRGMDLYNKRWSGAFFFKSVGRKYVKDSYFASLAASLALFIHYLFRLYQDSVDYFVAPSKFMRDRLLDYGFDKKRVVYLPNFIDIRDYRSQNIVNNNHVLFFGLFQKHKGVDVLLRAAKELPDIKFRIAGKGIEEQKLRNYAEINSLKNVKFLGYLDSDNLKKEIASSKFCVTPSFWYENMPYSVLEAFASGKPVIASNIGGIPEIVKDGENGVLFEAGNSNELKKKILRLSNNPNLTSQLGKQAMRDIEKKYSPRVHYQNLMEIYKSF